MDSRPAADEIAALLEPIARQRIAGADDARIANWCAAERGLSTETFLFDLEQDGDDGPTTVKQLVFRRPPEVSIFPDDQGTHFILEIVAGDRAGLLAMIAYTLAKANINIVSAKINTLGERAEDVFLIDGARLHDEHALLRLETALYEQLRV